MSAQTDYHAKTNVSTKCSKLETAIHINECVSHDQMELQE